MRLNRLFSILSAETFNPDKWVVVAVKPLFVYYRIGSKRPTMDCASSGERREKKIVKCPVELDSRVSL